MNFFNRANLNILYWALNAADSEPKDPKKEKMIDFAVGGQAVIEGVMMRAPHNVTIAVRKPDDSISVRTKRFVSLTMRYPWLNIPFLRGVINLFEMMIIGTEAINYSAVESMGEEHVQAKKENQWAVIWEKLLFALSFIVAMGISLSLFKLAPLWLTTFLENYVPAIKDNYILFNLIDGLLKISIFILYISVLTLFKDFKRLFEYHGAEHKAIHNYEHHSALTPENSHKMSRFHPRCGTSFILFVFLISIAVYTFIPKQDTFWLNLLVRIAVLPLIAGISYELLKFSARNLEHSLVKMMVQPGLWFQALTTREPKTDQLEVSIKSLKESLAYEKK